MSRLISVLIFGAFIATTLGTTDVVVQDLGCWKERSESPIIESWEGSDASLVGLYEIRKDALQKCAKVAQENGFKYFALREGGLCATGPLVEDKYTILGESLDCEDTGLGGILANQVYMINSIWDAKFVPLGCWRNDIEDLELLEGRFIRLMDNWQTREEAEEKCARAAGSLKYDIFALSDNGMCYGWPRLQGDLQLFARSTDCPKRGRGNELSVNVYHITQRIYVGLVDLGCWKSGGEERILPLYEQMSDILGVTDYKARPDAVERCAIYNSDWNHADVFAITDGGACAGLETSRTIYTVLGKSDECKGDGKGSKNANRVYKLIREVKNISYDKVEPFEPYHIHPLGCWKDGDAPLLATLEGTEVFLTDLPSEREDPVTLCARAAHRRGYDVFAIQEGKCFSKRDARKLFQIYGPSDECVDKWGGPKSNSVFEINTIRDPRFTNEGCYECQIEDLISLEHMFTDTPTRRKQEVNKCSLVAASLNYTQFALRNGGLCYGVMKESIPTCVKSAACSDDGKGGRLAIQLYKIRSMNNFTLENMGCWRDDSYRMIPTAEGSILDLSGRFDRREDAIGACARYARSRGFKVFSLQAGGMCMTSEHADDMYSWYGWSNRCGIDGKGGLWSNQVWRVKDDWWSSTTEWWKVPEPWNKLGAWNCTWQWSKTPEAPLI